MSNFDESINNRRLAQLCLWQFSVRHGEKKQITIQWSVTKRTVFLFVPLMHQQCQRSPFIIILKWKTFYNSQSNFPTYFYIIWKENFCFMLFLYILYEFLSKTNFCAFTVLLFSLVNKSISYFMTFYGLNLPFLKLMNLEI